MTNPEEVVKGSTGQPEPPNTDQKAGPIYYKQNLPSKLEKLSKRDIVVFKDAYTLYKSMMETSGHGQNISSIRTFISPSALATLHKFHITPAGVAYDAITDEMILAALGDYLKADQESYHTISEVIASELKMDLNLTPRDRILNLFHHMEEVIHVNHWDEILTSDQGQKHYVRLILNALEPWKFKNEMRNTVKLGSPTIKGSPTELSKLLYEKVDRDPLPSKTQSSQSSTSGAGKRQFSGASSFKPPKRLKPDTETGCLKCNEKGHHIKSCRLKPSPEEQKKLCIQHLISKGTYKPRKSLSSHYTVARISSADKKSWVRVTLANSDQICTGVLDSVADVTLISKNVVQVLQSQFKQLLIKQLEQPALLELPNNEQITINEMIETDLGLETKMGQLKIPKQRCLIFDQLNDEILLGNDLLTAIGIDPKRALDSLMTFDKMIMI